MSYSIIPEKCVNCTMCELICASDAIKQVEGSKKYFIESDLCKNCGECVLLCPVGAIVQD